MTARALRDFEVAPIGALLVAGNDVMVKSDAGEWYRASDHTFHREEQVAYFHGHSGYTITEQP